MSIIVPQIEILEPRDQSLRLLEHGWPSDLCRWHSHEEYELHFILETRGKAFVGDFIGDFQAGSFYLIGPNLPHNWVTDEDYNDPIDKRDMVIQFKQQCFTDLIKGFSEFKDLTYLLERSQSGLEFFNFDYDLAKGYFEQIRDSRGVEQILAFLTFMCMLNKHADSKTLSVVKLKQHENSNKKHAKIATVIDFIVSNFAEDISVAKAASMAGMSEASFSRNFQAVTGNRFVEFVNRVRIGRACVLLFETDEQVSSICYDVGFQNLANFNRHFLAMKQMTPSDYRDAARRGLFNDSAAKPKDQQS